jgi:hypothetical protein
MKTKMKLFALGMILLGFGVNVNAQVTNATANAPTTATIVAPLTITKTVDMNFGNVATTGVAGTVVLATSNSQTATGGVMLSPSNLGTHTAASFDITGEGAYAFGVVLPSSLTITEPVTSQTMTVNTFTMNLLATGNHLSSGAANLLVGATLNVKAVQAVGVYTNATGFAVTVAYE